MSARLSAARAFFEVLDAGRGWEACRPYCTPDAGFTAQAGALDGIRTVEQYAEWMRGLMQVLTDGRYELKFFGEDAERGTVCACATFIGTHLAGGPVPPTRRTTRTDYVYVMEMQGEKVAKLTKVWNSEHAIRELGWA